MWKLRNTSTASPEQSLGLLEYDFDWRRNRGNKKIKMANMTKEDWETIWDNDKAGWHLDHVNTYVMET